MKFGWMSNAAWAPTGYGDQTAVFLPRIKDAGHEPALIAYYGLEGGILNWNGIPVFPKGLQGYGQDIGAAHTRQFGADYLITLVDAWVFNDSPFYESLKTENIRWIAYFPIDSEPCPNVVRLAVERAYRRVVYSKFAALEMEKLGMTYDYIPHAVETNVMQPKDRAESREILQRDGAEVSQDAFLVGMVAANKGNPSRKAFAQQIEAFAQFRRKHNDVVLYIHASRGERGEYGGVNLPELCEFHGLSVGRDVLFPNQYNLFVGYPKKYMAHVFSAMDVHLLASTGEGFGIPIVEAQSCGVPVIVGDWTSMGELCFSGWKIPKDEADKFWTPLASYQFAPRVGAIVDALEQAYNKRGDSKYSKRARAGALAYDADTVVRNYWIPFLKRIEQEDTEAVREIEKARQMAGKRVGVG